MTTNVLTNLVESPLSAPAVAATPEPTVAGSLPVGTKVEVRRKFDDKWASGFEVAEISTSGVQLRRLSDGELIPVPFDPEDIRKERKRNNWWY